jgi:hypothetical protein
LDDDAASAELFATYEARIAVLERLVGRQALEIDLLEHVAFNRPHIRRP